MKVTTQQKQANRRRMIELKLWQKAMAMPPGKRRSYISGHLQVHLKIGGAA